MSVRVRFPKLQELARERGYGLERRGNEILWWRNESPDRTYSSFGVADAWEDIMLDHSLRNPRPVDKSPPREKTR